MNTIKNNIEVAENTIKELELEISSEKTALDTLKNTLLNLFNNYTKSSDIDIIDNEIMDLRDGINLSETKIKNLEGKLLNRKRSLWIYKTNTSS